MGLMDTLFGGGEEAAADKMKEGYDRADKYSQPYWEGGQQDYGRLRSDYSRMGNELDQYGNPADWMWQNAGLSPDEYYDKLMSGYSESPMAKHEQQMAMQAANNGASASGMMGSGAYYQALQQNAADISGRDTQRYYDNALNAQRMQQGAISNYQGQQRDYRQGMAGLADWGRQAGEQMGKNEMGRAQADADAERAKSKGWTDAIGSVAGIVTGW